MLAYRRPVEQTRDTGAGRGAVSVTVGERHADRDDAALRKKLRARARKDQGVLGADDPAEITINWASHPADRRPPGIFERDVCGSRDLVPLPLTPVKKA